MFISMRLFLTSKTKPYIAQITNNNNEIQLKMFNKTVGRGSKLMFE